MWNGDRLSFVQQYRKISSKPMRYVDDKTGNLFEHYSDSIQQLEHSSSNGKNSNETYQKF
jgi:hypothetical protein